MTPAPEFMRYIEVAEPGGPEVLRLATGPVPRPGPGEVLVRIEAAGINRADLLQRQGHYPPPPGASPILGMEISGHIAELSTGTTGRWQVGDPVCALLAGGGYAEYCVAPEGQCMAVPSGASLRDAASIPEAAITVWANLFEPRRLFAGNLFLVQGGSSGIGTLAIQIAHAFDARVATTAGTDEKCKFCLSLGADIAINYRTQDWAAELARWSRPKGIDCILDMIGGDYFAKHVSLLATAGRLVHIAFSHGSQVTVDLRAVMTKRLLITGSTLRPRTVTEKSSLARAVEQELWPLFISGQLRPIVDSAFPLERAADAHQLMESGRHTGKIVLEMQLDVTPCPRHDKISEATFAPTSSNGHTERSHFLLHGE